MTTAQSERVTAAEWLSDETLGARRLAVLCSLAARIEPQLLRILRLRLAPGCSAGDEAALWSAPIVQSASATGLVFKPDAQRQLQDELRNSAGDILDAAWREIFQLRTGRTWPDELDMERSWFTVQEELSYLALKGFRPGSMETLRAERLLAQVANTVGRARNTDASWWANTVLVRMPPDLFALNSARRLLANLAASQPLWVRLVAGGLELAFKPLDQGHAVDAPLLRPLPVEVHWEVDARAVVADVSVAMDATVFLALPRGDVRLKLVDGSVWELRPAASAILINVPPPPETFVDRERELKAALDALLAPRPAVTAAPPEHPLREFTLFARTDEELKEELNAVVDRLPVQRWEAWGLPPGARSGTREQMAVETAELLLLLVTPALLASEFHEPLVERAVERAAEGSALVIPIIARACDWRSTSLAKLSVLPRDGRAIADHGDRTARSMAWLGVSEDLERRLRQRRQEIDAREQAASRPSVVALVGPEGIGKFTLARQLVHAPAVRERFPDGIIWLGEDGFGYPRQWLRQYCDAVAADTPFGDRDIIDPAPFHTLFADRRVLFVAEHRTASDILPTLTTHAGPGCTVLVLGLRAPPSFSAPVVELPPIPAEAAQQTLHAFMAPEDLPADLLDLAGGNPLLLRLAAAGCRVVEPEIFAMLTGKMLVAVESYGPAERDKAVALLTALWSTALPMPGPGAGDADRVGGLSARRRAALWRPVKTHSHASRFAFSEFAAADLADLEDVLRLGLLEAMGTEIRLHPLLRAAIGTLMSGTIIISYRHGDDQGFAGRLYDRLEQTFRRQHLFMDVDSIAPGQDFVSVLEAQVNTCVVMLALIGRGWLTATDAEGRRRLDNPNDFVRIEIAAALSQGKYIIPVLIDNASIPRAEELPENLQPLARRHALRLTHDRFKDDSLRLVRALKKVLAEAEAERWGKEAAANSGAAPPVPESADARSLSVYRDVDAPWCPEMVALPAGEFLMGSPESEEGRYEDEGPQHAVTLGRRFGLGRYPVTVGEYQAFIEATGHRHEGGIRVWTGSEWKQDEARSWRDPGFAQTDRHPVVGVSWRDAVAYCAWLSEQTNRLYRLPSEAEWEYACRAGTTTRYSVGDAITANDANFNRNVGKTTEVGSHPSNPWGLYDMHGNVWEWVEDVWHNDYTGAPADGSAWTDGEGKQSPRYRVNRGGSWNLDPSYLRSAHRNGDAPDLRYVNLGFRVARTLD